MDLVRLAFEVAPERGKEIMRKIVENDKEITKIVEEMLEPEPEPEMFYDTARACTYWYPWEKRDYDTANGNW
jgi:hypothetical protein